MKLNTKLIILAILFIGMFSSLFYKLNLEDKVQSSFDEYEKIAKELEMIKSLKGYYKKGREATNEVEDILVRYKVKVISKKENKNNIEFSLDKLSPKEIDDIVAQLGNSGLRITEFIITRLDPQHVKLLVKVLL